MPLLSIVTFLPLVGAAFIFLARGPEEIVARNARSVALWTTTITFLVSLLIWLNFDNSTATFQFVEKVEWIGAGIHYHMGVDGISMLFVILTTFLIVDMVRRIRRVRYRAQVEEARLAAEAGPSSDENGNDAPGPR